MEGNMEGKQTIETFLNKEVASLLGPNKPISRKFGIYWKREGGKVEKALITSYGHDAASQKLQGGMKGGGARRKSNNTVMWKRLARQARPMTRYAGRKVRVRLMSPDKTLDLMAKKDMGVNRCLHSTERITSTFMPSTRYSLTTRRNSPSSTGTPARI
jgi:hypothetical protein